MRKLTEAQQHLVAQSWQSRALIATRGNQTLAGCVLIACLGKAASNPPRFVGGAVIDKAGHLWAPFEEKGGGVILANLGPLEKVRDGFRKMADRLRLIDTDRTGLMDCLKQWIVEDARTNPDLGDTDDRKRLTRM